MGPRYIMRLLKNNGHQALGIFQGVDECLGTVSAGFDPPISLDDLIAEKPDVVGFSIDSFTYEDAVRMAEKVKSKLTDTLILFGGVHVTIEPEQVMGHECVDAVCIGEGEYPVLELCDALSGNKDYSTIENMWVKKNGTIHKNPVRAYVANLDDVRMDREGLHYYGFFTGRGCTGNCTFCCTPAIKKIGAKGKFLRKYSVKAVIENIEDGLTNNRKYLYKKLYDSFSEIKNIDGIINVLKAAKKVFLPHEMLRFKDDSFLMDKKWFVEFADEFSKKFPDLSYACNARPDEIDEEVGGLLKKSNCKIIGLGFECGNDDFRKKVLKKRFTKQDILTAARILKKNNISILGQWMIGLPGESVENVLESIELSNEIGDIPQVHIAIPFPKTELFDTAYQMGLIKENYIPKNGVYSDFIFHRGEIKNIMRILYNMFNFKLLDVPEDYIGFSYLGRLRRFSGKNIGDVFLDKVVL
jgi:radical SAM superfamily enzyme YgiQ (UPF0313 family)